MVMSQRFDKIAFYQYSQPMQKPKIMNVAHVSGGDTYGCSPQNGYGGC